MCGLSLKHFACKRVRGRGQTAHDFFLNRFLAPQMDIDAMHEKNYRQLDLLKRRMKMPLFSNGEHLADVVVEGQVIVELKAAKTID